LEGESWEDTDSFSVCGTIPTPPPPPQRFLSVPCKFLAAEVPASYPSEVVRLGFSLATAKRWSLNIFAALLAIGVFGACFFYAVSKGIGDELIVKWMNIILTAAFVFGYAVKGFWRFRKRWAFWVGARNCLLLMHRTK
jgi:hypothetical protein